MLQSASVVEEWCPHCYMDSGGGHHWECPNNPDFYNVVEIYSDSDSSNFEIFDEKDEKIKRLEGENAMLRAEIGRLQEALWYYENVTPFG